jgi:hypothetical protein
MSCPGFETRNTYYGARPPEGRAQVATYEVVVQGPFSLRDVVTPETVDISRWQVESFVIDGEEIMLDGTMTLKSLRRYLERMPKLHITIAKQATLTCRAPSPIDWPYIALAGYAQVEIAP